MESSSNRAQPTRSRRSMPRAVVVFTIGALLVGLAALSPGMAALLEGSNRAEVLTGLDDDNVNNPIIQPAGVAANQSLSNTDVVLGEDENDVLLGLLGSDVMDGGAGKDIIVGGTEQATAPNSDIMFGGSGGDVNVWAPGDGSEAFLGDGGRDALVFGVIDRVNNIPTLSDPVRRFPEGVPTAEVTNAGGFCTLEKVTDDSLGYEFLARFFVRATGNLAVTVRVTDVEQVFCTSQAGGAITFADLTATNPAFVEIPANRVDNLNVTVDRIIR